MTTAPLPNGTPRRSAQTLSPEVGTAAAATLALGTLLVALAAATGGAAAAEGAAIGAGMVVAFFAFGALTVGAVATVSPTASMAVALLTYVLQVVAIGLVLAVLRRSGALDSDIDAGWVAGGVIAATAVWLVAHVVAVTRSREALYDLPEHDHDAMDTSAR